MTDYEPGTVLTLKRSTGPIEEVILVTVASNPVYVRLGGFGSATANLHQHFLDWDWVVADAVPPGPSTPEPGWYEYPDFPLDGSFNPYYWDGETLWEARIDFRSAAKPDSTWRKL